MRAVANADKTLKRGLDAADALKVGEGELNFGLLADYNSDANAAVAGGFADYTHKLAETVSAFARAEAGHVFKPGRDHSFARAVAGIRLKF